MHNSLTGSAVVLVALLQPAAAASQVPSPGLPDTVRILEPVVGNAARTFTAVGSNFADQPLKPTGVHPWRNQLPASPPV